MAAGPRGSERRRWSTYGTMAARPPACASGARFNPAVSAESSHPRTGAGPEPAVTTPPRRKRRRPSAFRRRPRRTDLHGRRLARRGDANASHARRINQSRLSVGAHLSRQPRCGLIKAQWPRWQPSCSGSSAAAAPPRRRHRAELLGSAKNGVRPLPARGVAGCSSKPPVLLLAPI